MRRPPALVWMLGASCISMISLANLAASQYGELFPPVAASLASPVANLSDFTGIAMGFRKLTADIAWIQTLLYYGTQEPGTEDGEGEDIGHHYPLFLAYCERVSQIDPYFKHVYYYGAGILGWNFNRLDEAEKLLRAGIKANPKEWRFQQFLAGLAFQKSHNINKLADFLEAFVDQTDCPNILRSILANIYKKQKRYQEAIRVWLIVYNTQDSAYLTRSISQIREMSALLKKEQGNRP